MNLKVSSTNRNHQAADHVVVSEQMRMTNLRVGQLRYKKQK